MRCVRALVCLLAVTGILAAGELSFTNVITDLDLAEAREPQPPPGLKASPARKDLDLRGDSQTLFERVAHEYGLEVVFDGDYQPGPAIHFRIHDVNYREALRALEAATGSFVFPVNEHVFMAAKDTPQKRQDLEPTVSIVSPIPQALTIQEVQELARAVQMSLQIQRIGVDPQRGLVLLNDRISKVRPAEVLFQELLHQKPQVSMEVELLEVSRSSILSYGLMMPAQFTLTYLAGAIPTPLSVFSRLAFPVGQLWGLTLGNAAMMANMNDSNSTSLYHTQIRSIDGQAATVHVGERYPILSSGYFGQTSGSGQVYTPPPTFNFEDLGLMIKITPHVNGMEEVSLDVNAEFKVLTSQSLNGIPVISSRKLDSKVRVQQGEWAVLAGLLSASDAKTISGIAGLNNLPVLGRVFRQNTRDKEDRQVLIIVKPTLIDLPPDEFVTRTVRVGSEARPLIPL